MPSEAQERDRGPPPVTRAGRSASLAKASTSPALERRRGRPRKDGRSAPPSPPPPLTKHKKGRTRSRTKEEGDISVEKSPATRTGVEKSPAPRTGVEKSPAPRTGVEKSPAPKIGVEKNPVPRAGVEKSPAPRTDVSEKMTTRRRSTSRRKSQNKDHSPVSSRPPSPKRLSPKPLLPIPPSLRPPSPKPAVQTLVDSPPHAPPPALPSPIAMEMQEQEVSMELRPAPSPCSSVPETPRPDDDESFLLFQRSLADDPGGSPTASIGDTVKRLTRCAFCLRGALSSLGQGPLVVFGPTPGYIPLHVLNCRASPDRHDDCHDHVYRPAPDRCISPELSDSSEFLLQLGAMGLHPEEHEQSLFDPTGQCCAHMQCALWSEGVSRGDAQCLLFVDKAIDSASTQVCSFCQHLGASLRCRETGCGRTYHFPCAAAASTNQEWSQKIIWCSRHAHKVPVQCALCFRGGGELLMCCCCGDHYHGDCLIPPLQTTALTRAGWQCAQCRVCRACGLREQDSPLLVCSRCDKVYHPHCLSPLLLQPPPSGWNCKSCRVCQRCGVRSSGAWANHPSLCELCDPAQPCSLCGHAPDLYSPQNHVTCISCFRSLHTECIVQAGEARLGAEAYTCTTCRPRAELPGPSSPLTISTTPPVLSDKNPPISSQQPSPLSRHKESPKNPNPRDTTQPLPLSLQEQEESPCQKDLTDNPCLKGRLPCDLPASGVCEAATEPLGVCEAATEPSGVCEAAPEPPGVLEAASEASGVCEGASEASGVCEAATEPPGVCEAAPEPPGVCETASEASGVCEAASEAPGVCEAASEASGVCEAASEASGVCEAASEASGVCEAASEASGVCEAASEASGVCEAASEASGVCEAASEASGVCEAASEASGVCEAASEASGVCEAASEASGVCEAASEASGVCEAASEASGVCEAASEASGVCEAASEASGVCEAALEASEMKQCPSSSQNLLLEESQLLKVNRRGSPFDPDTVEFEGRLIISESPPQSPQETEKKIEENPTSPMLPHSPRSLPGVTENSEPSQPESMEVGPNISDSTPSSPLPSHAESREHPRSPNLSDHPQSPERSFSMPMEEDIQATPPDMSEESPKSPAKIGTPVQIVEDMDISASPISSPIDSQCNETSELDSSKPQESHMQDYLAVTDQLEPGNDSGEEIKQEITQPVQLCASAEEQRSPLVLTSVEEEERIEVRDIQSSLCEADFQMQGSPRSPNEPQSPHLTNSFKICKDSDETQPSTHISTVETEPQTESSPGSPVGIASQETRQDEGSHETDQDCCTLEKDHSPHPARSKLSRASFSAPCSPAHFPKQLQCSFSLPPSPKPINLTQPLKPLDIRIPYSNNVRVDGCGEDNATSPKLLSCSDLESLTLEKLPSSPSAVDLSKMPTQELNEPPAQSSASPATPLAPQSLSISAKHSSLTLSPCADQNEDATPPASPVQNLVEAILSEEIPVVSPAPLQREMEVEFEQTAKEASPSLSSPSSLAQTDLPFLAKPLDEAQSCLDAPTNPEPTPANFSPPHCKLPEVIPDGISQSAADTVHSPPRSSPAGLASPVRFYEGPTHATDPHSPHPDQNVTLESPGAETDATLSLNPEAPGSPLNADISTSASLQTTSSKSLPDMLAISPISHASSLHLSLQRPASPFSPKLATPRRSPSPVSCPASLPPSPPPQDKSPLSLTAPSPCENVLDEETLDVIPVASPLSSLKHESIPPSSPQQVSPTPSPSRSSPGNLPVSTAVKADDDAHPIPVKTPEDGLPLVDLEVASTSDIVVEDPKEKEVEKPEEMGVVEETEEMEVEEPKKMEEDEEPMKVEKSKGVEEDTEMEVKEQNPTEPMETEALSPQKDLQAVHVEERFVLKTPEKEHEEPAESFVERLESSHTEEKPSHRAKESSQTAEDASQRTEENLNSAKDASQRTEESSQTIEEAPKRTNESSRTAEDASQRTEESLHSAEDASQRAEANSQTAEEASQRTKSSHTAEDASQRTVESLHSAEYLQEIVKDELNTTPEQRDVELTDLPEKNYPKMIDRTSEELDEELSERSKSLGHTQVMNDSQRTDSTPEFAENSEHTTHTKAEPSDEAMNVQRTAGTSNQSYEGFSVDGKVDPSIEFVKTEAGHKEHNVLQRQKGAEESMDCLQTEQEELGLHMAEQQEEEKDQRCQETGPSEKRTTADDLSPCSSGGVLSLARAPPHSMSPPHTSPSSALSPAPSRPCRAGSPGGPLSIPSLRTQTQQHINLPIQEEPSNHKTQPITCLQQEETGSTHQLKKPLNHEVWSSNEGDAEVHYSSAGDAEVQYSNERDQGAALPNQKAIRENENFEKANENKFSNHDFETTNQTDKLLKDSNNSCLTDQPQSLFTVQASRDDQLKNLEDAKTVSENAIEIKEVPMRADDQDDESEESGLEAEFEIIQPEEVLRIQEEMLQQQFVWSKRTESGAGEQMRTETCVPDMGEKAAVDQSEPAENLEPEDNMEDQKTPERVLFYPAGEKTCAEDQMSTEVSDGDHMSTEVYAGDKKRTEVSAGDQKRTEVSAEDHMSTEVSARDHMRTEVSAGDQISTEVSAGDQMRTEVSAGDQTRTEVSAGDQTRTEVSAGDQTRTEVSAGDETRTVFSAVDQMITEVSAIAQTSTEVSAVDQTSTEVSAVDQTSTEVSAVDQTSTEVSAVDQTSTEVSAVDQTTTEVSAVDQVIPEVSAIDQMSTEVSVGDQMSTEVSVCDQMKTEVSVCDQMRTEVSVGDQMGTEVSVGDQMGTEVSIGDQMRTEVSVGDQMRTEVSVGDQMRTEVSVGDQMRTEVSVGDQMRTEVCAREQMVTDVCAGEQTVTDVCVGEQTVTDVCVGEQTVTEVCFGDQSGTEVCAGDQSGTEVCAGDQTGTDVCAGDQTGTEVCAGDQTVTEVCAGDQTVTEVCAGDQTGTDVCAGDQTGTEEIPGLQEDRMETTKSLDRPEGGDKTADNFITEKRPQSKQEQAALIQQHRENREETIDQSKAVSLEEEEMGEKSAIYQSEAMDNLEAEDNMEDHQKTPIRRAFCPAEEETCEESQDPEEQSYKECSDSDMEDPVSPVLDLDASLDLEVMELMSSALSGPVLPEPRRGKGRSALRTLHLGCRPEHDLSTRLRHSPFSAEASPENSPTPMSPMTPPRRRSSESPPMTRVAPTVIPFTPKIGMGKPAITKRKFSPGRARARQCSWWSSRRAVSPPSSSQDSNDGWESPKPRSQDSPLWGAKTGRGSGFPGRRRSRGGGIGSRGGRGRSRLKTQDCQSVSPGGGYMESFQIRDEEDSSMHNTVVMFSTSDHFTLKQDMCVVCGSFGQGEEGRLLACAQCGQCYHPFCVNVKVTRVILTKGWRCLECTVCEACGQASDPGRLLLCDDCDISFHTYCLDPPLLTVPKGAWKCRWCVWCVQCGSASPGLHCDWMNNYSLCGPCCSLSHCPLCQRGYSQEDLILQCQQCDRWVHALCHGLMCEEEVEAAADEGFDCSLCKNHGKTAYARSDSLDSPYMAQIVSRCREPELKTYTQDGVCLTESGLSHLQALVEPLTSPRRYRRNKPKLKLRIINQNSVSVLQTPETPTEPEPPRDLDCEMKSDSSPERELNHGDYGLKETTEEKKRKRKPYRPGIGGFMVRQRGGKGPSRIKLCRSDSTDVYPGRDEDGDAVDTPTDPNNDKVKKRYRKKRTKLEETFPSYLQEAFFGRDLLDRSRLIDRRTGQEAAGLSQSGAISTKGSAPVTPGHPPQKPMSEELLDLSDVLNTEPHILGPTAGLPSGSVASGKTQRSGQDEPLDAILSPELDKMVTDGAILSKLYKIPELEGKDVEELFTAVLSPNRSQSEASSSNKPLPRAPGGQRLPLVNGLMSSAHFSSPMMPLGSQATPRFRMAPPPHSSHTPLPPGPSHPLQSSNQMQSQAEEQDVLSTAQRGMLKWEKEEPLGELATVAPVLYVNVKFPQLKEQYPDWPSRMKQIAKQWRKASSQDRAPFVQKARDNRAAQRIHKVQLPPDPLKRLAPPPPASYEPVAMETDPAFRDRPRETEQEQEWKLRQLMRHKSKQQAKIEATQKLEQVKNEQLMQQRQQQLHNSQRLCGGVSPMYSPDSPMPSNQQPALDDVFLRPQNPPLSAFSPSSPQMFSPPSSRPSSPWDPYAKVVGTPRPQPPLQVQRRNSLSSPAHDALGSASPDTKGTEVFRSMGPQQALRPVMLSPSSLDSRVSYQRPVFKAPMPPQHSARPTDLGFPLGQDYPSSPLSALGSPQRSPYAQAPGTPRADYTATEGFSHQSPHSSRPSPEPYPQTPGTPRFPRSPVGTSRPSPEAYTQGADVFSGQGAAGSSPRAPGLSGDPTGYTPHLQLQRSPSRPQPHTPKHAGISEEGHDLGHDPLEQSHMAVGPPNDKLLSTNELSALGAEVMPQMGDSDDKLRQRQRLRQLILRQQQQKSALRQEKTGGHAPPAQPTPGLLPQTAKPPGHVPSASGPAPLARPWTQNDPDPFGRPPPPYPGAMRPVAPPPQRLHPDQQLRVFPTGDSGAVPRQMLIRGHAHLRFGATPGLQDSFMRPPQGSIPPAVLSATEGVPAPLRRPAPSDFTGIRPNSHPHMMPGISLPRPISVQTHPSHSIMGQPHPSHGIMGQPHPSHSMMGQPHPSHGIMGQPHPSHSIMGQPHPSHSIMGQPHPSHSIMGQPYIELRHRAPEHRLRLPFPEHEATPARHQLAMAPSVELSGDAMEEEDSAVKDLEDVEVKDLVDLNLNLDPEDGKEDLDLAANDLHLDDFLLSGKFDLIAYADPEMNLDNAELDLDPPDQERKTSDPQDQDCDRHKTTENSGQSSASMRIKQEVKTEGNMLRAPPSGALSTVPLKEKPEGSPALTQVPPTAMSAPQHVFHPRVAQSAQTSAQSQGQSEALDPSKPRPLLLEEQPLLLQDLLDQERQEQEQQKQMQALIRQRSSSEQPFSPMDFDSISDPIMKAKMVALKGINRFMSQGPLGMNPMARLQQPAAPNTAQEGAPPPPPLPGAQDGALNPPLVRPTPPNFSPGFSNEGQRRQYEEWLGETQRLLQMQQRLLEEQISAHRKTKKALSAKQRTARRAGRSLSEEDEAQLRYVTDQQGAVQRQLEQIRKQQKDHSELIEDYRSKLHPRVLQPPTPGTLVPTTPGTLVPTTPGALVPATPAPLVPPTPGGPPAGLMQTPRPPLGPGVAGWVPAQAPGQVPTLVPALVPGTLRIPPQMSPQSQSQAQRFSSGANGAETPTPHVKFDDNNPFSEGFQERERRERLREQQERQRVQLMHEVERHRALQQRMEHEQQGILGGVPRPPILPPHTSGDALSQMPFFSSELPQDFLQSPPTTGGSTVQHPQPRAGSIPTTSSAPSAVTSSAPPALTSSPGSSDVTMSPSGAPTPSTTAPPAMTLSPSAPVTPAPPANPSALSRLGHDSCSSSPSTPRPAQVTCRGDRTPLSSHSDDLTAPPTPARSDTAPPTPARSDTAPPTPARSDTAGSTPTRASDQSELFSLAPSTELERQLSVTVPTQDRGFALGREQHRGPLCAGQLEVKEERVEGLPCSGGVKMEQTESGDAGKELLRHLLKEKSPSATPPPSAPHGGALCSPLTPHGGHMSEEEEAFMISGQLDSPGGDLDKKSRLKRLNRQEKDKPVIKYKRRKRDEEEILNSTSTDPLLSHLRQLAVLPLMEPLFRVDLSLFPPFGSSSLGSDSRLSGSFGNACLDGVTDYYSTLIYKQNNLSNPPTPPASLPPTPPPVPRQKLLNGFTSTEELSHKELSHKELSHKELSHKELSHKELSHKELNADVVKAVTQKGEGNLNNTSKTVDVPASLPTPPHNNQEDIRLQFLAEAPSPSEYVPSSSPESVADTEISRYPDLSFIKLEPQSPCSSPPLPVVPCAWGKGSAMKREVKSEPNLQAPPSCTNTDLVTLSLTLNPVAAQNVPGVMAAVARLLRLPVPLNYQLHRTGPERSNLALLAGVRVPVMQGPGIRPHRPPAPVNSVRMEMNTAPPPVRPQNCSFCQVPLVRAVRQEAQSKTGNAVVFCSSACSSQFNQREASKLTPPLVKPLHHYNNNMSSIAVHTLRTPSSDSAPSPPLAFPSASAITMETRRTDSLKVKVKLKPRPRAVPGGEEPRQKRPKNCGWRRWSISITLNRGPCVPPEPLSEEDFQVLGACLRGDPVPKDLRRCCFCLQHGDGVTDGPARLLNLDLDLWVHLNCALWSSEVYETQAGALINVELALRRGLTVRCAHCHHTGATSGCNRLRCTNTYHFSCAIAAHCTFFKDKTMLCHLHKPRSLALSPSSSPFDPAPSDPYDCELRCFAVFRRVYVQRDEARQIAAIVQRGERQHTFRVGSLLFRAVGRLLPAQLGRFHSNTAIFPVGYHANRLYWSMRHRHRRCKYMCYIEEKDSQPLFKIKVVEKGHDDLVLTGVSPKAVWEQILEPLAAMRLSTASLKLFPVYLKGEELFGLTTSAVTRIIESLPGVEACERYSFRFGKNPLMEWPLAFNPSGSARSEPKASQAKRPTFLTSAAPRCQGSVGAIVGLVPGVLSLSPGDAVSSAHQGRHSKASQYRRMTAEWKTNVYLARSRIQGLGLYAARDIEKCTMVIEYIGTIIRSEVANRKERLYESQNRGVYMFRIDNDYVIDATITGGPARYINHSCSPNCITEVVSIEKENKIIISSCRRIQRGEELSYDYKFDFEDDQHKIPCHCGAVNCRKWMN